MEVTAQQLAQILGGKVEGDEKVSVSKPAKIEEAKQGSISFLANMKYEEYAYSTEASILLVPTDFAPKKNISSTLIRVENVYACVSLLLEKFGAAAKASPSGNISSKADIHDNATLGENTSIGAFSIVEAGAQIGKNCQIYGQVFIGKNVKVGDETVLHPGVKLYQGVEVGKQCILHANVVIGSDGFGFAPQSDGTFKKVPQIGIVIIEDDVEIGSNTVIDRGTMGATLIKKGVKLDNLIQIAHNVEIGENTVIAAQAGIAGSTKIGKQVMIGGQAGFVGHIKIADRVQFQAQSGVSKSIKEEGSAWYGSPAIPYKDYLRSYAFFKRLPDMAKELKEIKKTTKDLGEQL